VPLNYLNAVAGSSKAVEYTDRSIYHTAKSLVPNIEGVLYYLAAEVQDEARHQSRLGHDHSHNDVEEASASCLGTVCPQYMQELPAHFQPWEVSYSSLISFMLRVNVHFPTNAFTKLSTSDSSIPTDHDADTAWGYGTRSAKPCPAFMA
jgi:hypothetical protein